MPQLLAHVLQLSPSRSVPPPMVAKLSLMRGIPIAVVLVASGTAGAAPLASLVVDGEAIELTADGVLHAGAHTSLKLAASATAGRLGVAHPRGKRQLVVEITTAAGTEAVIVAGDPWREVARVPVGGVGLDHDFGYAVDATPNGIYRYQTRGDIRRCDGKPAYLFAEGFDGTVFRRLTRLPTEIPDTAPALVAKLDAGAAAPPMIYHARAASLEPGVGDAGGLGIPAELDDGAPATVWHEELAASAGEGQFFTFESRVAEARAKELRIVPAGKPYDRPRALAIVAADGAWTTELPDAGAAFTVELPAAIAGCVTVVLVGSTGPHTGIAELEVYAEGERAEGGEAMLAHALATGSGAQATGGALARQGAAGAAAIDAELARTNDPAARQRLVRALLAIRDPAAAPSLAHAATAGWVRDADLLEVIAALAQLGQVATLRELAARTDLAPAARITAVRGLRGEAAFAPLVELAGGGPREIRHQVIESLAGYPVATLVAAAQLDARAPASADLWRAVTRRAHSAADERAAALAAMVAALPAAADYERRYRLVDGLAQLGDVATVDAFLRALPAGPETAALRQVAIHAVAPGPAAAELVVHLAGDPDPGVRLAALAVLAVTEGDASSAWHVAHGPDGIDRSIVTLLSTDRWPEVRRRAADALASRCLRAGPAAALTASVGGDRDGLVRVAALAALVQCKAAGTPALLAKLWDDGDAPIELRGAAVDQVVALEDPALAARLVGKFTQWRGAAIESKEALELAQHAAAAIGRTRAPGAGAALAAGLEDGAFPEIVTAAALGLGALGPACPASAKARLQLLARDDNNDIAVAARRAAAQCGR